MLVLQNWKTRAWQPWKLNSGWIKPRLLVDLTPQAPGQGFAQRRTPVRSRRAGRTARQENPAAVSRADSPGIRRIFKQLLPPEQVTLQTVPLVPTHCERCCTPLPVEHGLEDPEPTRLFKWPSCPDLKAKVTEYQRHSRTCPCCGQVNQAPLPEDFPTHSIGPAWRR